MSEFTKQNVSGANLGLGCNSKGLTTPGGHTAPEVEMPKIGDTMYLIAYPYGGFGVYMEGNFVERDSKIVEVEVKKMKTMKVTFE